MADNIRMTDGGEYDPAKLEIDPATGQQRAYVVLSEEERAKGFVRPLRRSYVHVGNRPRYPLRDLTDDERERYKDLYAKYEPYPASEAPLIGRFWTQAELDKSVGCGAVTTMGLALCETYASNPKFYTATFCSGCKEHWPVNQFRWVEDNQPVGS